MQRALIPIAAIFFVASALAQTKTDPTVDRTFHFKNISSQRQLDEVVTALRQVAGTPPYSFDVATAMVTVRGTPAQVALANWLVEQLDVSAGKSSSEYPIASVDGKTDGEVARVFYLANLRTTQSMQELLTTLRQVGQPLTPLLLQGEGAIVLRGNAEQVGLTSWLIEQLDVQEGKSGSREYKIAGPAGNSDGKPHDEVARVTYLANLQTPQSIQELITTLRQVASVNKIFALQEKPAIVFRDTPEKAAFASWLVDRLDVPPGESGVREYPGALARDQVSRVFYLSSTTSPQSMQELITTLRVVAEVNGLFSLQERNAIALRASPDQAKMAEWLVHTLDQPALSSTSALSVSLTFNNADDQIAIFHVPQPITPDSEQRILSSLRAKVGVTRAFVYSTNHSLIARGSNAQIAIVQQLVSGESKAAAN